MFVIALTAGAAGAAAMLMAVLVVRGSLSRPGRRHTARHSPRHSARRTTRRDLRHAARHAAAPAHRPVAGARVHSAEEDRVRPAISPTGERTWAEGEDLFWHEIVAWPISVHTDLREDRHTSAG